MLHFSFLEICLVKFWKRKVGEVCVIVMEEAFGFVCPVLDNEYCSQYLIYSDYFHSDITMSCKSLFGMLPFYLELIIWWIEEMKWLFYKGNKTGLFQQTVKVPCSQVVCFRHQIFREHRTMWEFLPSQNINLVAYDRLINPKKEGMGRM